MKQAKSVGHSRSTEKSELSPAQFQTIVKTDPNPTYKRFTLLRAGERPIEFDGAVLGEVEMQGSSIHPKYHRAAVYKTKGGKFIVEFVSEQRNPFESLNAVFEDASIYEDKNVTRKVEVFDDYDRALAWFRPGKLTIALLKKLGKWDPEFIE